MLETQTQPRTAQNKDKQGRGRLGGPMVSFLDYGSEGPGLNPRSGGNLCEMLSVSPIRMESEKKEKTCM